MMDVTGSQLSATSLGSQASRRSIKRKRTASFRGKTPAVAPGLKRYLSLRGTPAGVYEITRIANWTHRIGNNTNLPNGICFPVNSNPGTTGVTGFTFVFNLGSISLVDGAGLPYGTVAVPNYSEIAALFDEVKLDKVEVQLNGAFTQISGTLDSGPCQFLLCTDDNSTDVTQATMQQQGDTKLWVANNVDSSQFNITVKPKFQQIIYYSALTSSYEAKQGYIRSDVDVPHYGLKMLMCQNYGTNPTNPVGCLQIFVKYFYKCKSLK